MRKLKISLTRYAGQNDRGQEHAVVRLEGGSHAYRRMPCPTCPWRKTAVGEFPAEAFRISAHTAYDMAMEQFACHASGKVKPATCAGFLLRGARHNLGARLAASAGRVDIRQVSDGGAMLFHSYRDMAVANGVDQNDPVLRECR